MRSYGLWALLVLCSGPVFADKAPPSLQTLAERAAKRFPQPVRVGDLIGRDVLEPTEAQPVLGHVTSVVREKNGNLGVIISIGGVLGIGTRSVNVPLDAMAVLGEYVACIDLTPGQLAALPTDDGADDTMLAQTDAIRVGIVKPFH